MREFTDDELALMHETRQLQRAFNSLVDKLRDAPGVDARNVALAQTHGEDAFARALRAIERPARETLVDTKLERMDAEMR